MRRFEKKQKMDRDKEPANKKEVCAYMDSFYIFFFFFFFLLRGC